MKTRAIAWGWLIAVVGLGLFVFVSAPPRSHAQAPSDAPPQAQGQAPAPSGAVNRAARPRRPAFATYDDFRDSLRESTNTQVARELAIPYKGITTSGTLQPGLYPIKSTGVSTEGVRKAAEAFLAALTPEQRALTQYKVDDPQWRRWNNVNTFVRQGVGMYQMTESQREAGINLMRASLSATGLQLSRDVMRLSYTLGEITNRFAENGEWYYYITILGTPSATEPWGWQIQGHHLIINYFVLGDQVVMSPNFWGSEPTIATSGKYQGTSVLQQEQQMGLDMIRGLNDEQRKKAIIKVGTKQENENVGEAFKDNIVLDYAGIRSKDLSAPQKTQLANLIAQYVDNMDDGHAKVKMAEVRSHLDDTYFAWIGAYDENSVFYYRIHSPVILIEYDHQQPIAMRDPPYDPNVPTRNHVHVVVRTPNGNDYGKDLLREHYLAEPGTHAE
jgi:hypothetical protein